MEQRRAHPLASAAGLRFGGSNAYVTFGDPSALRLGQPTLETWFRRDGAGITTSTGTGGISNIVPLIAKGRDEGEGSLIGPQLHPGDPRLGQRARRRLRGKLLGRRAERQPSGLRRHADHERCVAPRGRHLRRHPVEALPRRSARGAVDGRSAARGLEPPARSLGSALNSTGVAAGFFKGALDEARIWNLARSQTQIQASINSEIAGPASGLVARWGLNETPKPRRPARRHPAQRDHHRQRLELGRRVQLRRPRARGARRAQRGQRRVVRRGTDHGHLERHRQQREQLTRSSAPPPGSAGRSTWSTRARSTARRGSTAAWWTFSPIATACGR